MPQERSARRWALRFPQLWLKQSFVGRFRLGLVVLQSLAACADPNTTPDSNPIIWQTRSGGVKTHPADFDRTVVFATDDGYIRGLARSDGQEQWETRISTGILGTSIVKAGGLAIVPQWDLWAIDPSTGEVVWRFAGPDSAAGGHNPVASGDTVFTASPFGWVSAVDANTGIPFWSEDLNESPFGPVVSTDLVIYGTRGFLGTTPRTGPLGAGHIVALARSNGREVWRFQMPDSAEFEGSGGAVSGGVVWRQTVIVGSVAARVYALALESGEVVWEHANGQSPRVGGYRRSPAILTNQVVLARDNGIVEARDPDTGNLLWERQLPVGESQLQTRGRYGYVGSGSLAIFDTNGNTVWQFGGLTVTGGVSFALPRVAEDGMIFVTGKRSDGDYAFALMPPVH